MRAARDDETRSGKPVRIPSLPPRTAPQPVIRPEVEDDRVDDDERGR